MSTAASRSLSPAGGPLSLGLAALLIGSLGVIPVARADRAPDSHVLIVAQNKSLDQGVRALRFADDDGAKYWELFSRTAAKVSLLTVLDPETARLHPVAARKARVPWLRNLRQEVRRIAAAVKRANKRGRKTAFTFIYVGHGNVAKDGEGYVNLQDVRLKRSELFHEIVDQVPASTVHLIIDACKSFFLVTRGPGDWRDDRSGRSYGDEVKAFLARGTLSAHPHVGAILSTSGDEDVHEWSALRAGVFSHQLRSGLRGAADINGDGRIEYSEVGAFIAAANRRVVHQRARIRAFVRAPAASRHATLFNAGRAGAGRALRLELGKQRRGRFSVEDDRGVRLVDLNKAPGLRLRLALEPGRRYFVRYGRLESIVPRRARGILALKSLERGPASSDPRGSVDMAYRNDLFAVAFGLSFYEGYLATSELPAVTFDASAADEVGDDLTASWGLRLDLSYALSPVVLDDNTGAQHTVSLGARKAVWGPIYLALRAELGYSAHDEDGLSYGWLRPALLGGVGISWRALTWLELALEADAGYQALIQTGGTGEADPSGAKFGTQLLVSVRPWRRLPQLGLELRAGIFGHTVTETDQVKSGDLGTIEKVSALPELALGLSWGF
jgi:hypothetical protein